MKFFTLVILIALCLPPVSLAEEPTSGVLPSGVLPSGELTPGELTPEKTAAIQELIEATGAGPLGSNISETYATQIISSLKSNHPDVPEESFDIIRKEIELVIAEELDKGSFQNRIYPIYAKYFTEEDIKGLIEFNKSALGRKANEVMPQLLQESMHAGQSWSQELRATLVERVTLKLKQEGIEFNNPQ
jgi:hypothetical protein